MRVEDVPSSSAAGKDAAYSEGNAKSEDAAIKTPHGQGGAAPIPKRVPTGRRSAASGGKTMAPTPQIEASNKPCEGPVQ